MPHVQVVHTTRYSYVRPVRLMPHRLMVRPQDSHDLRLNEATLAVDPAPGSTRWAHDVFGNSICMLDWPAGMETASLRIVSRLDLSHYPAGPGLPRATLQPEAELFPFSYSADEVADLARLSERHLADPERQVDAWARRFVAGSDVGTLAMLEAMTHAIHQEFRYAAREEMGTQTPVETLSLGSGACRDFALLMMEAVRSLGLAARFVSGYLYNDEGGSSRGGGTTHAWCSVYLPGAGWVEYDPTNGLVAGRNLVRVAVTRTPEQAVPISGGFIGSGNDFAGLTVDVRVTVPGRAPVGRAGGSPGQDFLREAEPV
ncbi:MAG: transglutaminase family protein [Rubritepida sp.]|nr:transglutaminase family protein [Rubritepida sp.]